MSIIIAPDSFKGSISAEEFCAVAESILRQRAPHQKIYSIPLADGGEGTLDCVLKVAGGEKRFFETVDALGAPIQAPIGFLPEGDAIIEVASVIGLPLVRGRENPMEASTYGLGVLVREAIDAGAKRITLTLGGSATNDLGLGMLQALGWQYFDTEGNPLQGCGKAMEQIASMQPPADPIYQGIEFSGMCDVQNPLLGAQGCAEIFSRQKGASEQDVLRLEAGAANVAACCGFDPNAAGAGAAGGLGYACLHFLGGRLRSGIQEVLRLYKFEEKLQDCELLISGEGCFDGQSAMGKAVGTVLRKAGEIPAVVFAGMVKPFDRSLYPNLKEIYAISEGLPLEIALQTGKENLRRCLNDSQLPYPYCKM